MMLLMLGSLLYEEFLKIFEICFQPAQPVIELDHLVH